MINSIQAPTIGASVGVGTTRSTSVSAKELETTGVLTAPSDTTKISTLSRQLSESAERSEKLDNSMSRSQLGDMARKLRDQFSGDRYAALKALHDSEMPKTDDPELLVRAKEATKYLNIVAAGDKATVKNPFFSLSLEQLTLIAYDDSGAYTVNERRTAYYGAADLEEQWRRAVLDRAWAEGGTNTKFYTEVLAHYKALPLVEQSFYPADYEASLQAKINDTSDDPKREEDRFLTLVEILANIRKPEKDPKSTEPTLKTNNLSPDASPSPAAALRS